jgi:hypothetical protein
MVFTNSNMKKKTNKQTLKLNKVTNKLTQRAVSNRGQVKRAALSLLVSSWSFGRCSASETAFSSYSFMLLNILVGMKRNEPAIEEKKKKEQ